MGQFDQTVRPLAKMDGGAFLAWALSCCDESPRWRFLAWDDTRRLVCPGEPDRTNDLVLLCRDAAHPRRDTWLIVEIEEEADPGILWRAGQYEILLGKEVNPACHPLGSAVGSLVVNLSGSQRIPRLDWSWSWDRYGSRLAPLVVDVGKQDAGATLARIEAEEVGLTVLPFLALMKGSGSRAFIDAWKGAVERLERAAARQVQYREAALVLAELTPHPVEWIRATEGWMARESAYIKSWERVGEERGELRNARSSLCAVIEARFRTTVPEPIRLAIEGTNDLDKLNTWLRAAATAENVADLRKEIKLES